jgi:hypothetical protein
MTEFVPDYFPAPLALKLMSCLPTLTTAGLEVSWRHPILLPRMGVIGTNLQPKKG